MTMRLRNLIKLPDFKSYTGGDLKGPLLVTRKLDGVCVYLDCEEQIAVSKRGKKLHNFENIFRLKIPTGYYEVFYKDWDTTVSLVRTHGNVGAVRPEYLYPIYPSTDPKLFILDVPEGKVLHEDSIWEFFKYEHDTCKHEGLVIWPEKGKPSKVKGLITIDVRVTGVQEGTGKYEGMLGALLTKYGKVGTGFKDKDRVELLEVPVGTIIEVSFMEWTKGGKMRHPRFIRVRWDKDEENLEGND